MKFGICASPDKLTKLAPGTIDYLEMNLTSIQGMDEETLKKNIALLREANVPAETTNCFFPPHVRLCGEEYDPAAITEYTKRALDNAARLGVQLCVIGSGKARHLEEGREEECRRQVEESVVRAADLAHPYGITIVVEPLRAAETNYIITVAEGGDLCRRLHHPNIGVHADLYHMADAGEPLSVLTDNAALLRHFHIAAPGTRAYPAETDGCDYAALAKTLHDAGYDRRISIEGSSPEDFAAGVDSSIAFLRRTFA